VSVISNKDGLPDYDEERYAKLKSQCQRYRTALKSIAYFKESLCSFGDEGKVIELAEQALKEAEDG